MRRTVRLLLVVVLVSACTRESAGVQPGILSATLQDPNAGSDGALLVTLSGPGSATNVLAASGDTVWGGPFAGPTIQLVVTGQLANGVIFTFAVPDVSVASQYKATITEAAATSDYALRVLMGYTLTVTH